MGQRSRRRERTASTPVAGSRPSRSEQRNAEARAGLQPLSPGERPGAVAVAAALAIALAIGNVVFLIAGVKVGGKQPAVGGVLAFSALMVAAAVGMWRGRYWAVLGFEALLGVTILIAALSLVVVSSAKGVAICLITIAICGPLFYKLVRAMARLQMPQRKPPR